MFQQQIICISLSIIFVGSFAQQLRSNDQIRNGRRDVIDRQVPSSQSDTQRSVQNGDSAVIRGNNIGNQLPPTQPKSSNQGLGTPLPISRSLANSTECKADIQKNCAKGSTQRMNNLNVLQCIDDLDNVSFSQIGRTFKLTVLPSFSEYRLLI